MEHTENYQLSLWEQDDRIMREDFNADNAKLDAALKAANDRIDTKANAAALGAETTARENADTALGGRIDSEAQARQNADTAEATARASADTALGGRIDSEAAARAAAVSAISADLGSHGHNLRIATGSYTGDGIYGSSHPNSLTFDFTPVLVFISSNDLDYLGSGWMIRPFTIGAPAGSNTTGSDRVAVTWHDHGVSWYTLNTYDLYQSNHMGYTYHWLALGYDE